ncbi:MAG: DUF4192 family protein, partial [Nocardioides sp.]
MTTPALSSEGPSEGPMTLRSAEDVLAAIRVVLGFEPRESLVLITVGGRHPLQARVDLPVDVSGDDLDQVLDELAAQLLEPVGRVAAECVLLVAYTDHERLGQRCLHGLVHRLTRAGTSVADALRADGRRWYPLDPDRPDRPAPSTGVPYDVDAHPFVVAAVVEGRVVHDSRDDLVAMVRPDPAMVAEVERD